MSSHAAVVSQAKKGPLEIQQVPTVQPGSGEVMVSVQWTASSPFDLHMNDGGLMVQETPQILGTSLAGKVIDVGPDVKSLKVDDAVFGFGIGGPKEKGHQEVVTMPEFTLGKIPESFTMQEIVTVGDNLTTAFHAISNDLGIELPWPKPSTPPAQADTPILIWGGASSVGQYAIQVLHYYGFKKIIATASKSNHEALEKLGAASVFDYRDSGVADDIKAWAAKNNNADAKPSVPFVLDCRGSQKGSLVPISKIAEAGTKVAMLLPVIVRDSSEDAPPEYAQDIAAAAPWAEGVHTSGVIMQFYANNPVFKEKLQPEIIPELLVQKVVAPNKQRVIEGDTLLERAQKAIDALRRKEPSGERLVWRVSE